MARLAYCPATEWLLLSCAGRRKELAYLRLKLSVVEWVVKIVRHRSRRIVDKQL